MSEPATNRTSRDSTLPRIVVACAFALTCIGGPASEAFAGNAEPQTTADPAGDLLPLPDCEATAGSTSSPPGEAGDITAVEVSDTDATRLVTVHAGDVDGLIRSGTDARVEVWVAASDTAPVLRFRRGRQGDSNLDDVVLADGSPAGVTPVAVDAGTGGAAMFQFPFTVLDQLGLLGDSSRFGVVVVAGARCDKLGLGRAGLAFRALLLFGRAMATPTSSAAPTTDSGTPTTHSAPTPSTAPGAASSRADDDSGTGWIWLGGGLGLAVALFWLLWWHWHASKGAPPTPQPEQTDFPPDRAGFGR